MLIQYDARLDARTSHGDTILHLAVSCSHGLSFIRALSEVDLLIFLIWISTLEMMMETLHWISCKVGPAKIHADDYGEDYVACIRAFEALFHKIQESKGIPPEERYPPLRITTEYDDDTDANNKHPTEEPAIAIPGSYPE